MPQGFQGFLLLQNICKESACKQCVHFVCRRFDLLRLRVNIFVHGHCHRGMPCDGLQGFSIRACARKIRQIAVPYHMGGCAVKVNCFPNALHGVIKHGHGIGRITAKDKALFLQGA